MAYATRQEVFSLALAAPAFVAYARPFDAAEAATATIRLKGHGLATGDLVTFENSEGGFLPTGITEFDAYSVTVISSDLFRVNTSAAACYFGVGVAGLASVSGFAATSYPPSFTVSPSNEKVYFATPASAGNATAILDGFEVDVAYTAITVLGSAYRLYETTNLLTGTALDFAVTTVSDPLIWQSAGEGWSIAVDQGARLDAIAEERTGYINEHLTAHAGGVLPDPITGKYPQVLIGLCARLTARQAIASLEVENPQYRVPIDRLLASEEDDKLLLKAWKEGKPIQPRPLDDTPTIAENSPVAASSRTEMPWQTGTL